MVSSTPMTIHPSGMQVATGIPTEIKGTASNVPGGLLNAAAAKTAATMAQQAGDAKAAGVNMRGGGTVINVPSAPEGGSVPGVSFAGNHANLIGIANQLKAGAVYDNLAGSQPYKVGGKRTRRRLAVDRKTMSEEPAIGARRKHKRKTKKHVRRRNHRNSNRHRSKLFRSSRRTRRSKRT